LSDPASRFFGMSGLPVCEVLDDGSVVSLDDVAGTVALLEGMEPGPLAMSLLLGLRGVTLRAVEDGMAELVATLPAADAECVFAALDGAARRVGRVTAAAGERPGPVGARRAEALVGWARQALADPGVKEAAGRPVEAQVIIDLPTLLGLADNPGELAGVGPVPAEVARALAADDGATWRRLVVEPVTGALLDYGTTVYREEATSQGESW